MPRWTTIALAALFMGLWLGPLVAYGCVPEGVAVADIAADSHDDGAHRAADECGCACGGDCDHEGGPAGGCGCGCGCAGCGVVAPLAVAPCLGLEIRPLSRATGAVDVHPDARRGRQIDDGLFRPPRA